MVVFLKLSTYIITISTIYSFQNNGGGAIFYDILIFLRGINDIFAWID